METNWRRTLVMVAVAALIAGIMFTGGCQFVKDLYPTKQEDGSGLATAELLPGVGPDAIADVVSQTSPAVVKISTRVNAGSSGNPFLDDPFFRQFFGLPDRQQEGLGSGFIMSADGYVLTNEHVIDGADEITVTVTGINQELPAKVVGADYDLDLALLKLEAGRDLPYLPLGNSDQYPGRQLGYRYWQSLRSGSYGHNRCNKCQGTSCNSGRPPVRKPAPDRRLH